MVKKFDTRTFPLSVIVAVLGGGNLFPGVPLKVSSVAEVNEFLFPKSGRCTGIQVISLAQNKSRPEILRQYPDFERWFSAGRVSVSQALEIVGSDRVELESTGE